MTTELFIKIIVFAFILQITAFISYKRKLDITLIANENNCFVYGISSKTNDYSRIVSKVCEQFARETSQGHVNIERQNYKDWLGFYYYTAVGLNKEVKFISLMDTLKNEVVLFIGDNKADEAYQYMKSRSIVKGALYG